MVVKPICFQNMPYTPGCRLFFSGGTVILAHWSCPTLHKGQCDSLALSCTLKYALMLRIVMFSCWYFYPNKMQSFKRECCLLLLKECPDIKIFFLRASPVFLKIKDLASCPQGDVKQNEVPIIWSEGVCYRCIHFLVVSISYSFLRLQLPVGIISEEPNFHIVSQFQKPYSQLRHFQIFAQFLRLFWGAGKMIGCLRTGVLLPVTELYCVPV